MKQIIREPYMPQHRTIDEAIVKAMSWMQFNHEPVTVIPFKRSATLMTDSLVVRIYPID